MDDGMLLLLSARLDETLSIKNINEQIKSLAKKIDKINLIADVDTSGIVKLSTQIKQVQESLSKSSKVKVFDSAQLQKENVQLFSSLDEVVRKYQQLGQIKVTENFDAISKNLKGFSLQVTEADGLIRKLKFDLVSLSDGSQKYMPSKIDITDNTQAISEKNLQEQTKINHQMEELDNRLIAKKEELRLKILQLAQVGALEKNQLADLARMLNNSENLDQLKTANQEYSRLLSIQNELLNIQRAKYTAQQREEAENIQIDKQNKALQQQIELYQRRAQINVQNLKSSSYGNYVDQASLRNYLDKVNNFRFTSGMVPSEVHSQLQNLTTEFKQIQANAKTASGNVNDFADTMTHAVSKFATWLSAGTLVMQGFNFLKDGIKYVADMNNQLTQIQIVTGKTSDQIGQLSDKYREMAYNMSLTTKEVAEGATSFYKRGMDDTQVSQMLEANKVYSKISDLDPTQSAELLTAAVNSMHIGVQKVIDDWAVLDSNSAASADELGKAFQKVGGSAESLGLDFSKINSWTATLLDTTREAPETIGNSMKSILARIQNLKEKGFDALENGETTSVNQVAKALDSVGISLMDNQGQFRNFGQVLDELGAKWQTLDSVHKSYISTQVAGSYQSNRFISLMQNYSESVDLFNKELSATGTAQQRFNVWSDSIEAHMNRLKDATTNIWQDSFNSDSIKGSIDTLTSLVNGIDAVVKKFGILPPIVAVVSTAFLLFSSRGQGITSTLTNVITNLQSFDLKLIVTEGVLKASMIAVDTFKASLRALAMSTGIGLVLAGISYVVEDFTTSMMESNTTIDEAKQKNEELAKSWETNGASLQKLTQQYTEMSKSVDQGKISTDSKEFLDIQKQIANIIPQAIDHIDAEGQARLKNADAVNEQVKAQKALYDAQVKSRMTQYQDNIDKVKSDIKMYQDGIDADKQKESSMSRDSKDQGDIESFKVLDAEIANNQLKIEEAHSNISQLLQQEAKDIISQKSGYDQLSESTKRYLDTLISGLKEADVANGKLSPKKDLQIVATMDIEKALQDPMVQGFSPEDKMKFVKGIQDEAKNAGISIDWLNQELQKYLNITIQGDAVIYDFGSAHEKLNTQYENLIKNTEPVRKAIDELNSGHKLSISEIDALIEKYPDLKDNLKTVNGQLEISVDQLYKKRDADIDAFKTTMSNIESETSAQKSALQSRLNIYGIDLANIKTIADAQEAQIQMLQKAREMYNRSGMVGAPNVADPQFQADYNSLEEIAKLKQSINGMKTGADAGLNFLDTQDNAAKGKESVDALTKALNENADAMDELKSKYQTIPKSSQEFRDNMEKEIDLLNQRKDLMQAELKSPTSYMYGSNGSASSGSYTGQYADIINKASSTYGISPALIAAVIRQESSFNANAVSGAGAQGLMQLMPDTARGLGVNNSFDPEQNIMGGVKYLSQLLQEFGGDIKLALAGYNAGAGNAKEALNGSGYAETKSYVASIMASLNGDNSATVNIGANTKDAEDKIKGLKKDIHDIDTQIWQAEKDITDSYLAEIDIKSGQINVQLQKLSTQHNLDANRYGEYSDQVKNDDEQQIAFLKQQQDLLHAQKVIIDQSGLSTDEYTQKVQQLQTNWQQIQDTINQIQERQALQQLNKETDEWNKSLDQTNDTLDDIKSKIDLVTDDSDNKKKLSLLSEEGQTLELERAEIQGHIDTLKEQAKTLDVNSEAYRKNQEETKNWTAKLRENAGAIKSVRDEIVNLIVDGLNNLKDQDLQNITDKQKKVIDALKKSMTKDALFDKSEFISNINDLFETLDNMDGKITTTVSDNVSSSTIRSDLSNYKSDILSIADALEKYSKLDTSNKGQMENYIKGEIKYASDLKHKLDDVNAIIYQKELLYKQQEDALQNQIDKENERLKQLDDEYSKQDRLKQIKQSNDELDKALALKNNVYIDNQGKEVLTYDRGKVDELRKQQDDMLQQYQREDLKQAIQDNINRLQKSLDDEKKIHQAELDALKAYANNLKTLYSTLTSDINNKIDELSKMYDDEKTAEEKHWNDLINNAKNGSKGFYDTINDKDSWFNQAIKALGEFGNNIQSIVSSISSAIGSLGNIQMPSVGGGSIDDVLNAGSTVGGLGSIFGNFGTSQSIASERAEQLPPSLPKHHDGGFVGGSNNNKIARLVNKLFNTKPNEQNVTALLGELMAPTQNILNNFVPNIQSMVGMVMGRDSSSGGNTTVINIERLELKSDDPADMFDQLRHYAIGNKGLGYNT